MLIDAAIDRIHGGKHCAQIELDPDGGSLLLHAHPTKVTAAGGHIDVVMSRHGDDSIRLTHGLTDSVGWWLDLPADIVRRWFLHPENLDIDGGDAAALWADWPWLTAGTDVPVADAGLLDPRMALVAPNDAHLALSMVVEQLEAGGEVPLWLMAMTADGQPAAGRYDSHRVARLHGH